MMTDPIAKLLGSWSYDFSVYSIIFKIAISIILASVVGCERASKRHAAGLRTFILVSLASTLATMADIFILDKTNAVYPIISAASVIGVAIISGNSILYSSKNQIRGLTTSAGLWTCGIIGITIGAGMYTVTLVSFLSFLFCLSILPAMEKYLKNRSNHFEVHLELKNKSNLQDFVATIRKLGLRIDDIELNPAYINSGLSVYTVAITISSAELKKYKTHSEIIEAMKSLEYVYYIEEMN